LLSKLNQNSIIANKKLKFDPQDKPLGVRAINLNPYSTTAFALLLQHGIHAEHVG
jgi:hypothetical protein